MIRLTREVRCSIGLTGGDDPAAGRIRNGWGMWPVSDRLSPSVTIRVTVAGEPDATTGYLMDIKRLDSAVREVALPQMDDVFARGGFGVTLASLARVSWEAVQSSMPADVSLELVDLRPTPYLGVSISKENPDVVRRTEQFEFAASHRLHCPELSDEENRRLFGKCNNPSGHGHNYVIEVAVDERGDDIIAIDQLEQVFAEQVISRFDHKHLNLDTEEFAQLNPTVENIARVIFGLLQDHVKPASLANVRVYETAKTWADFDGK